MHKWKGQDRPFHWWITFNHFGRKAYLTSQLVLLCVRTEVSEIQKILSSHFRVLMITSYSKHITYYMIVCYKDAVSQDSRILMLWRNVCLQGPIRPRHLNLEDKCSMLLQNIWIWLTCNVAAACKNRTLSYTTAKTSKLACYVVTRPNNFPILWAIHVKSQYV